MVSTYTSRSRLNKQAAGDNTNTWGDVLNSGVFDLIDTAMDGFTSINPTGGVTLTTANGAADQARARTLKLITATTTATVTIPASEKLYIVWNATTAAQTIASSGGGTTVSIAVGEVVFVICDATNVKRLTFLSTNSTSNFDVGGGKVTTLGTPTASTDAATKLYVDNTAFNMAAGSLPAQTGNNGAFLTTNGTTASWAFLAVANLSDYVADQATRATTLNNTAQGYANTAQTNATNYAIAFAVAL